MRTQGRVLRLAGVARILAAPLRVRVLTGLLRGEASVSDLAGRLQTDRERVSYHLAVLRRHGLVRLTVRGRLWLYRVSRAQLVPLLRALDRLPRAAVPPGGATTARRTLPGGADLRQARTCYDHLGGAAGVYLLQEFLRRRWLMPSVAGEAHTYRLTTRGARALVQRGVNVFRASRTRRLFACACPDWVPPHRHLGGALGAALLERLYRTGLLTRVRQPRAVVLRRPLGPWVGSPAPNVRRRDN